MIWKKINYIHENPVKAGYVTEARSWKYSSARNIEGAQHVQQIDDMGFLG